MTAETRAHVAYTGIGPMTTARWADNGIVGMR